MSIFQLIKILKDLHDLVGDNILNVIFFSYKFNCYDELKSYSDFSVATQINNSSNLTLLGTVINNISNNFRDYRTIYSIGDLNI